MRHVSRVLNVCSLVFLLLLGTLFGIFTYFSASTYVGGIQKKSMKDSLRATCVVRTRGGVGTGILLDTGYVITAGHVVASDGSREISLGERYVYLDFHESKDTFVGRVLYYSYEPDIAIIEMLNYDGEIKGVKIGLFDGLAGDRIYTIGAVRGDAPMISDGYISYGFRSRSRASCFVTGGSSGGGIFNENNELIGVVTSVGIKRVRDKLSIRVPIPGDEGKTIVVRGTVYAHRVEEIGRMCLYVSGDHITQTLEKKGLLSLFKQKPEMSLYEQALQPWPLGVFRTCGIILFSAFIFFIFRRHIISP